MANRAAAPDELSSERGDSPRGRWASPVVRRGLAAASLVALAAVVGTNVLASPDQRDRRQTPEPSGSGAPTAEATPTPPALSAMRWAVRGDLADDAEFARAVLATTRRQQPGTDLMLYAATLPDGSRLAMVAESDQASSGIAFRGALLQALHVPSGRPVAEGRLTFAGHISSPDDLTGWAARDRDGGVVVVLLARPVPLVAQVSGAIDFARDGTASRSWRDVTGRDGSVIVALGRDVDPLVAARASYDENGYPLLISVGGELTETARDRIATGVDIAGLGGSYRGPDPRGVRQAVVAGSWVLLDPRRAQVRVLWSGHRGGERAALLLLRRADGPVFQLLVVQVGGPVFAQGLRHLPWDDAELAPWLHASSSGGPPRVINPSGAGTVEVDPAGGGATLRIPIGAEGWAGLSDNPVTVAAELSTARVTVRSPAGRVLARTTWSAENIDDPFVLEG